MQDIIASDLSILDLNKSIYTFLKAYVDDAVDIRFDLPGVNTSPIQPTISVFLYDIHEDLQLNTSESCLFSNGVIQPIKVNVSCNYLIMFWDKIVMENNPDAGPVNQATIVMNQVLNALINNRQLKDKPGSFTRVISPKEELNSMGNFWQSLGNRPRLLLNYSVTIPISLTEQNEISKRIDSINLSIKQI